MERLMSRVQWRSILALAGLLVMVSSARGQTGAYIGYVYPAGGQQGTTVQLRLGGQRLDGVHRVLVSGEGVSAKVVKYFRPISAQENSLLREQLNIFRQKTRAQRNKTPRQLNKVEAEIKANIDARMGEYCNRPACVSIASLCWVEVTIAPDAEPGERDLRLVTERGVTNPMAFCVGQVPEVARKAMRTSDLQVLGKEYLAQRKRPEEEVEVSITVPCTVNGQIASGEVNWYRFPATKGQRLVLSTAARQLVPYIADAVPGWFQPVLAVYDADGNELAYDDDFRFKPDPTLLFEVPEDGEYRFSITDAIYRGREDFVYRVTVSELPFVTNIFPLGGPVGEPTAIEMNGWNLDGARLIPPPSEAGPGIHTVTAEKDGMAANAVPFALDTLPECLDDEDNNSPSQAQEVQLPIIVNGRIDTQDDWDVFQFAGSAGDTVVAEVIARRLDSPLDSMLKITDPAGNVLAFNDDSEDVGTGLNTHHADSYVMFEVPADGTYCVHLGDTSRNGGEEYAYRLRISAPRPDFELRVVPSSALFRSKGSAAVDVYAIRRDGFTGDIRLKLKDAPEGFIASNITLAGAKDVVRLSMRTTLQKTQQPVLLSIEGQAMIGDQEVAHEAVPAEDRMQAFLWRHLVPAQDFPAVVYNPSYQAPATRVAPPPPPKPKNADTAAKPAAKFSKGQVQGRLRQLKFLYEEWLLTDEFYQEKVAECEAAL
jgi:hypothetical protein